MNLLCRSTLESGDLPVSAYEPASVAGLLWQRCLERMRLRGQPRSSKESIQFSTVPGHLLEGLAVTPRRHRFYRWKDKSALDFTAAVCPLCRMSVLTCQRLPGGCLFRGHPRKPCLCSHCRVHSSPTPTRHCIACFSVAVRKHHNRKGLLGERVHFGLWFLRSRVHHGGKSWPDSRNRKLADGSFNPTQKTEKAGGGVRLYTPPPQSPPGMCIFYQDSTS